MSQELQASGQYATLSLWGSPIRYDKKVVQLQEFSAFLEQRAKKSAVDFLKIGAELKIGWLIMGTDFHEEEMRRVCLEVSEYLTTHQLLEEPNWELFLQPQIMFADAAKQLILNLHDTLTAACINNVREQAQNAYRHSLANNKGLGFGIISNSLTAHFLYAMQAAQKERENEQIAQDAATRVWRNSNPLDEAGEWTAKAYHESHEPFVLNSLAQFYADVEAFIYTGVGYEKSSVEQAIKQAAEIVRSPNPSSIKDSIILALNINICCGEAILAAVLNNCVDDSFIDFCNHAPAFLHRCIVTPMVAWLKNDRHSNQLYNRPIFHTGIQKVISSLQSILYNRLGTWDIYQAIIYQAYAPELDDVIACLSDLCHATAQIVNKYAKENVYITVSPKTIGLFITLCNDIKANSTLALAKEAGWPIPINASRIEESISIVNERINQRAEEIRYEEEAKKKIEYERMVEARQKEDEQRKEAELQRAKNRKMLIIAAIITLVAIIAFSIVKTNLANAPYRKLEEAITNRTLTEEMLEWDADYYNLVSTDKGSELIKEYLNQYKDQEDIQSALWLFSLMPYSIQENMPSTFNNWIWEYAKEIGIRSTNQEGSSDYVYAIYYEISGYNVMVSSLEEKNGRIENLHVYRSKNASNLSDSLSSAVPGDTVTFGAYEQDGDTSNGAEAIEWIVLDRKGTSVLVVSKKVLAAQIHTDSDTTVNHNGRLWKSSTLFDWLNGIFLNSAFSETEQERIILSDYEVSDNPKSNSGVRGDGTTTSYVSLLSIDEYEKYDSFLGNADCTQFAKSQGLSSSPSWWLRSPGKDPSHCASASDSGISYSGIGIYESAGVRPFIWIDASK